MGGPASGGTPSSRRIERSSTSPPVGEMSALALTEGNSGGAILRKMYSLRPRMSIKIGAPGRHAHSAGRLGKLPEPPALLEPFGTKTKTKSVLSALLAAGCITVFFIL